MLLFHGSLLIILGGALLTFTTAKKGHIHLRTGESKQHFTAENGSDSIALPFTITLAEFNITYYPGSEAASDYISQLKIQSNGSSTSHTLSMNRIVQYEGYRLYQSSFDPDCQGSWLSVNYDPWGTPATYSGYLLLAISMLWLLFTPNGGFRRLIRMAPWRAESHSQSGSSLSKTLIVALMVTGASSVKATPLPTLLRSQADSLARTQVIYHDRTVPLNTLAIDFVKKIYGDDNYHGLSPEQVIGSWLLYPQQWNQQPIIHVKDAALRQSLGAKDEYIPFTLLFEADGTYKLHNLIGRYPAQSKQAKSLRLIDEQVGLVLMLLSGKLIIPAEERADAVILSPARINAELIYNAVPFSKILFMFTLTFGFLGCLLLFNPQGWNAMPQSNWVRRARIACRCALWAALIFHSAGYLLRWYIAGRIPLSNGYETMQFMALALLAIGACLQKKLPVAVPFALLLSGFTLLVSYIAQQSPQITPLMPVLASPWLTSHVSFIMMSYALFAFTFLAALVALLLSFNQRYKNANILAGSPEARQLQQLYWLSRVLLYPALFLLTAGIFLGAVWANVSWGRYWAWDPKEVWALITMLIYAVPLHAQSLSWFRSPRHYHIYMLFAFASILMTYFGVNYVLGGMHSYA